MAGRYTETGSPATSLAVPGERGRLVFSSSENPIRYSGTQVLSRDKSLLCTPASFLASAAECLFATLFPSDCRLCSTPLINISRLPVCRPCLAEIRPIKGDVCAVCGERLLSPFAIGAGPQETRCGLCRRAQLPFTRAVAYGSYDGGLRELIHLLKYEHVRPAARVLGQMLAKAVSGLDPDRNLQSLLVIPVPLHRRKLRQRGFNQSELIAWEFMKAAGGTNLFELHSRILERRRETESQIGLTRHQRRVNIRGAFAVARPKEIFEREILLIDDVFTTGTTASECARILRRAGASKVYVATVARTLMLDVKQLDAPGDFSTAEPTLAATG